VSEVADIAISIVQVFMSRCLLYAGGVITETNKKETESSQKTTKQWRGEPGKHSSFKMQSTQSHETRSHGETTADNQELACKFGLIIIETLLYTCLIEISRQSQVFFGHFVFLL
jgi:hypothetical protein